MGTRKKSPGSSTKWTIPCTHPDYLIKRVSHDFSILATGAGDHAPHAAVSHVWKGGFNGRPELLGDMWPTLVALLSGVTARAAVARRNALLSFWRFLDALEGYMASAGIKFQRVVRLADLTELHFELYSKPGPEGAWQGTQDSRAVHVRGLVKAALYDNGLPDLLLPALAVPLSRRETPSEEHGLAVIKFLRSEVLKVISRWRGFDRLAESGRNLIELQKNDPRFADRQDFVCTEADVHTTFRALIKATGNPVPQMTDMCAIFGSSGRNFPQWWARYPPGHHRAGSQVNWTDLVAGTYPTSGDVAIFFLLFVARSAWNPSTAASLNVSDWTAAYDDQRAWIYAPKDRSKGTAQWTVSRVGDVTGCHSLVTLLLERSADLRSHIKDNPALCSMPDVGARSPWIGVTVKGGQRPVYVVDPYDTRTVNNWLISKIDSLNDHSDLKAQRMTVGVFRDIAAAAIFKDSHYSSWIMMVLLGHKNLITTRSYGYRRASFEGSFALVSDLIDDVFSQLRINRVFDVAVTRAKLSGLKLSEADIDRLKVARLNQTYDGSGCADPCNPPANIDPTNPKDGCTVCIQQHRCASSGCPNCFVFTDSLSLLCRRVAELEAVRASLGAVRFDASSDASDLKQLRATLLQWPVDVVLRAVEEWATKIESGEHRPVLFAGQH